jgi:hypothetical protein
MIQHYLLLWKHLPVDYFKFHLVLKKRMHGFGILKLNSYKNLSISIFYFILEFADFV